MVFGDVTVPEGASLVVIDRIRRIFLFWFIVLHIETPCRGGKELYNLYYV